MNCAKKSHQIVPLLSLLSWLQFLLVPAITLPILQDVLMPGELGPHSKCQVSEAKVSGKKNAGEHLLLVIILQSFVLTKSLSLKQEYQCMKSSNTSIT